MENLEVRFYEKGEIIIRELDECNEVLFVLEGVYNVGYEINKIVKYRRQFGFSTVIGGFQICFKKRYIFNYMANTNMICYALRRKQWLEIMKQFPEFSTIIK
jgi:signal-transduction protein with cAMP-binding, CBS, and nucleotidyltransferase domain